MSDANAWLDRREPDVPVPMRAPIRSAVSTTGCNGISGESLLDASLICLRDALERGEDRSAAVHLLAADALLTWAFGAAVTEGPMVVHSLADRAAAALAALLPGSGA